MKRKTESKKELISSTSLKLFVEKGIKGTTTKEIAKKAGIAEGTIYRHFKSKKDISLKLFISSMNLFSQALKDEVRQDDISEKKLLKLINKFFEFAEKQELIYQYVIWGHQTEFSKLPSNIVAPKDIFIQVIKEGMERGEFKKDDENLAASAVIGMMIRTIFFMKQNFIKLKKQEVIKKIQNYSLNILKAKAFTAMKINEYF
ncbi:MAG: TetR/AcrR family transcriptional regulator [Acidobacteriota bacterium]